MLSRRDAVKTLTAGAVGLAAAPMLRGLPVIAAEGPTITVAYPADISSWDPIATGTLLSISVNKCVFDKPMNIMADLSFGPAVVTAHRFLDQTAKVLELDFRPGVTFHNGDPLTSDDFKFTFFDRIRADTRLGLAASWNNALEAIETPSPTKAVMYFRNPFPAAPQLLGDGTGYILPRKYFEKVGREAFIEKPIGSGPYRLVSYERDSRIVLEAYDKHWNAPPKIKNVVFQIIKDTSARIAAIQAGQVDFAHNIPVREVTRLGAVPGLTGALHPITSVILIHMVNKGIYKDQNLRLAMHHAIDKQALSNAFFGGKGEPLNMWAGQGMAANDPKFQLAFDPARARALLANSGYNASNPAKINFTSFNGVFANDFDIARAVVQMWKNVGIEANLSVMEVASYAELSRNDKLEAPMLYSWFNASGDPYIYSGTLMDPNKAFAVWRSDDIWPKLSPLLSEADYDKRIAGYREFDRWIVEQGYAVPLMQGVATVVHSRKMTYTAFRNGWTLPYYWGLPA
jgi:peptide/nickel transport system substrate-binding protein